MALLAITLSLGVSLDVFSQKEEAIERLNNLQKVYVIERVELTEKEEAKFLPLYSKYLKDRMDIRMNNASKSATKDATAGEYDVDSDLDAKEQLLKLEKTFREKMKDLLSDEKVSQVVKAEKAFKMSMLKKNSQRSQD